MSSLSSISSSSSSEPGHMWRERNYGAVNWLGLWTLAAKEVSRFIKVHAQTITSPVITILLYYAIFSLALGGQDRQVEGVPYIVFLAPGLVMMGIAQNAFANTSSSLVISKIQGNIVDVLMAPLSSLELTLGYALGGITRGLVVGTVSLLTVMLIAPISVNSWAFLAAFAFLGSMMLSLIGILGGLWSEKFDNMATVQNFIIMPATFLSGTFYSARGLGGIWENVCYINPFFYMIDGFRYGMIGISDASPLIGFLVMTTINITLFALSWLLIERGYKLKD